MRYVSVYSSLRFSVAHRSFLQFSAASCPFVWQLLFAIRLWLHSCTDTCLPTASHFSLILGWYPWLRILAFISSFVRMRLLFSAFTVASERTDYLLSGTHGYSYRKCRSVHWSSMRRQLTELMEQLDQNGWRMASLEYSSLNWIFFSY